MSSVTADHIVLAPLQANLARRDLLPTEHYVDRGYVGAEALVASQRDHQITLVGPVQDEPSWQAHTPNALAQAQFAIDWDAHQVRCPAGKVSQSWTACQDRRGGPAIVVKFARGDCQACARRADCTTARWHGRQVKLRPREHWTALQAARERQQTPEFLAQYQRRAGVEGSFTQANRRSDLRHARYAGLAKTQLQHVLTAVAVNVLRLIAWVTAVPRATTRTAPFVAVMASSP